MRALALLAATLALTACAPAARDPQFRTWCMGTLNGANEAACNCAEDFVRGKLGEEGVRSTYTPALESQMEARVRALGMSPQEFGLQMFATCGHLAGATPAPQ